MNRFLPSILALALTGATLSAQSDKPRIVSLGGSITEIIVELGRADQLVAVDSSSTFPAEKLAKLPRVGYYRQIGAEGVLSLQPTLVLTTSEVGPKEAVDQLKASGVNVKIVPETKSLAGAREKIIAVAEALGAQEEGAKLLAKFDASLTDAKAQAPSSATGPKPKVLFIMNADGQGALNVAGAGTGIDAMIREAGGANIASGIQGGGYQAMGAEAVAAAQPDVVIYPTGHGPAKVDVAALKASPALANSPASREGKVYGVDLTLLAGYGPRSADGLKSLVVMLHGPGAPAAP